MSLHTFRGSKMQEHRFIHISGPPPPKPLPRHIGPKHGINDVKSTKGSSRADAFVIDSQESDTHGEDEHQALGYGGDAQTGTQPKGVDTLTAENLGDGTFPRVVGEAIRPQMVTSASSLDSPPPRYELIPVQPKRTVNDSPFGTSGNGDTMTSVHIPEDSLTVDCSQPAHQPRVPVGANGKSHTLDATTLGNASSSDDSDCRLAHKRKCSQTVETVGHKRRSKKPKITSAQPRKSLSRRCSTLTSRAPSNGIRYGSDGGSESSEESGEESGDGDHDLRRTEKRKLLAGYESLRKCDRSITQPLRSNSKGPLPSSTHFRPCSTGETRFSTKYVAPRHTETHPPDIAIYPLSKTIAFVTALFRGCENIRTIQAVGLLEDVVGDLELKNITAKPVEPGTWFLTCLTHHVSDTPGHQINQPSTALPGLSTTRQNAVSLEGDSWSDSHDIDESLSDGDANNRDENSDDKLPRSTKGRRWSPEEDSNLRRWKNKGKPWEWIYSQYPNRTPGAVSARWYTKLRTVTE